MAQSCSSRAIARSDVWPTTTDFDASATVVDETIVSQLVTYRDSGRTFPTSFYAPCATVYAGAFGLGRETTDLTFDWFDDQGALQQTTPFDADWRAAFRPGYGGVRVVTSAAMVASTVEITIATKATCSEVSAAF